MVIRAISLPVSEDFQKIQSMKEDNQYYNSHGFLGVEFWSIIVTQQKMTPHSNFFVCT